MDKKFLMSSLLTGSQMPMFDLRIAAHDEIERLEGHVLRLEKENQDMRDRLAKIHASSDVSRL